jgi:hypothetical protein
LVGDDAGSGINYSLVLFFKLVYLDFRCVEFDVIFKEEKDIPVPCAFIKALDLAFTVREGGWRIWKFFDFYRCSSGIVN